MMLPIIMDVADQKPILRASDELAGIINDAPIQSGRAGKIRKRNGMSQPLVIGL